MHDKTYSVFCLAVHITGIVNIAHIKRMEKGKNIDQELSGSR